MSKYTITIKNLLDNNFDFKMNSYPIFDENYRSTLNQNILYHYYENEIGFETAPLFRFYLNQTLNEIMPYYNELYKVQQKILNDNLLLNNVNLTENFNSTISKNDTNDVSSSSSSSSNSNSNANANSKNLFQDTPQGQISSTELEAQTWATNLNLDNSSSSSSITDTSSSSGSSTNNFKSNSTNDYIKNIIGNNGSKFSIDLLSDIKNNLLSIDLMIINDLSNLFMQIF